MGRKPRRIDGVITKVRAVEAHKGQFRVRFHQNGISTEASRAKEEDAKALHKELSSQEILEGTGKRKIATWLTPEQGKQAELAFQILGNEGLIDLNNDQDASVLAEAARKYSDAAKRQGPPIKVEKAYEEFIAHQSQLRRSRKTILDYERYVGKKFILSHGAKAVYLLTAMDCHEFVMGYKQRLDQFKSYGYLYAFLNFCMGKRNPAIDPTKGKPWLPRNPMNFEKPVYQLKTIESFTLTETEKVLQKAYETGSLGYIVFRLFTLCRYEELLRFVSLGGGSRWDSNKFIDLSVNQIEFNSEVFRKRSNSKSRGRHVQIGLTFRAWIDFCIRKDLGFTYNRLKDENARMAVPEKFGRKSGYSNLLRHTAITMHLKAHGNAADTANIAGTSTDKIDSNYYNARVAKSDAELFYKLTPEKLGLK